MPAVSVIIPFYNRPDWVLQAVGSVLAGSFADFELILVDDGSSESIPDFHGLFGDRRIRYVRQENRGAAAARNLGIDLATGRYLAFLDSDDLFFPDKLAKQYRFMEENPAALLSHTSYQRMDAAGGFIDTVASGEFRGRLYPEIISCCLIATPTVMIRSEALAGHRFDENLKLGEDVLLWIQLARDWEIFGMAEPLTKVRMHGGNAVLDPEKQLDFSCYLLKRLCAEDPSLTPRIRARARFAIYSHQAYLYYKAGNIFRCARFLALALLCNPLALSGFLAQAWRRVFGRAVGRSIFDR